MKTHRMEEFETPINLFRLMQIAIEWEVPLTELYVDENYEMDGSGMIWLEHMS